MMVNRRDIVVVLPIASVALPRAAWAAEVDPPSRAVFGSTGRIITFGPGQANKTIAAALLTAAAGDVVRYPVAEPRGQIFSESVGVPDGVTLDLGGRLTGGGTATPSWTAGAILDGTGIADPAGYVRQMGGVVALGSMLLKGAEVRAFGMQARAAGGTAGLRAAGDTVGHIHVDNCHIHDNQNGIGPGGSRTTITVTNAWLHDNQLDPTGLCHNIYASNTVTVLIVGPGVTSTQPPMPRRGGGHAVKSRASNSTQIVGPCYLYSGDASCLDIPDGSAAPCPIGHGVIFVKKAADVNHTVFGYCAESQINGTAGVHCVGVNIVASCPGPDILNNGFVSFDAACRFTGNKPVATQPSLVAGIP
ncbi:MAG TPA: hypothetical protein VGH23_14285 [Rhizomicrobium sp.]|jgi:hypothetical protein